MITFNGRGILLDIEGTVAPIAFVAEVLFPFARAELPDFLRRRWDDQAVVLACQQVARDAGSAGFGAWAGTTDPQVQQAKLVEHLGRLMDADVKATGLKEMQGLIWAEGYQAGRLHSSIYPDVPAALRDWAARGLDVCIYSSGSVAAQKVFFAHTEAGDLGPCLRGYFDTTTGPKREWSSYERIVAQMQAAAGNVLFISDVVQELDAAAKAGLQTALALRPGNAPVATAGTHPVLTSMDQVRVC